MEAITSLVALWSVGFWILITIFLFCSIVGSATESYGFLSVLTVSAIILFGPIIVTGISLKVAIWSFVAYLLIGSAWSIARWYMHVNFVVFKAKAGIHYNPTELYVSEYKSQIILWIVAWPVSIFWTVTHNIFETMYDLLIGVYDTIANKAMSEIKNLQDK